MKRLLYIFLFISLASCQAFEAIPSETVIANTPTPTTSPTAIPTLTLLPTPKACPSINADVIYKLPEAPFSYEAEIQSIADFLNAGGDPKQLSVYFQAHIIDLNADSMPELLVREGDAFQSLLLFSCINGVYQEQLGEQEPSDQIEIMGINDFNKNGIPEIIYKGIGCSFSRCGFLSVIEWDGEKFSRILKDKDTGRDEIVDYATMSEPQDAYLKDLDSDGIPELFWTGELTPEWYDDHWTFYPQRLATHSYKWDGENYSALPVIYSPPEFRFQAVQDGDRFALAGEYQKALEFYGLAINNNDLDWWTEDRWLYIVGQHGLGPCANSGTPCPPPNPDPKERLILSAYATFRIMLVNMLTNNLGEAEKTYQKILSDYPIDNPGFPIAEIATLFWNEYKASRDIAKACIQSIDYITKHPDILTVLVGTHNGQEISYDKNPHEVCPFR